MFYIKRNDTSPAIQVSLTDVDGAAVPVTGATVKFNMRSRASVTPVVSAPAAIVDGPGGVVAYEWIAADTATEGTFYGEFEVTYADGSVETFPNRRNIKIRITKDIG